MKTIHLLFVLMITSTSLLPQHVYSQEGWLKVAWILVSKDTITDSKLKQSSANGTEYLKFHFFANGTMLVASHYELNGSNAITVPYTYKDNLLRFGFDNQFKMISADDDYLVLDKVINQKTVIRYQLMRAQRYLDKLPLRKLDIIPYKDGVVYRESMKLYAKFKTINPDFHAYFNQKVREANPNPKGENYFKATFIILPNGTTEHIRIINSISEEFDEKAIKAILSAKRKWTLPLLEGQKVGVLKTIEDHYTKR